MTNFLFVLLFFTGGFYEITVDNLLRTLWSRWFVGGLFGVCGAFLLFSLRVLFVLRLWA